MLTLITGRAGAGKTAYIMDEIRQRVNKGDIGINLLVPEQYSHDAERQLCKVCGDRLSLHGETLSFSRLCNRVFAETGGAAESSLDKGGQMLVMRRAVAAVAERLIIFGKKNQGVEFLEKLLTSMLEMKSLVITPERLWEMSELTVGALSDKLRDLAIIFGAYESLLNDDMMDPSGRLDRLAERIGESSIGDGGCVYIDGFNDFTGQEMAVIRELFKKGADITVGITCDGLYGDEEVFAIPRKTAIKLQNLAKEYGAEYKHIVLERLGHRAPELEFVEKELFRYETAKYEDVCEAVEIYSAPTVHAECEYAAMMVLECVRSGYRWRDIGVMARDWVEYRSVCENVFEKFGIEYFSGGRVDVLQKPPIALIDGVLEIITSGWKYKSIFKYLKTGLLGISTEELSELENYVIRWDIQGTMWTRKALWKYPPSGNMRKAESDAERLARINRLRQEIIDPIVRLKSRLKAEEESGGKLHALYDYICEIKLPERLQEKAQHLMERGDLRLAEEYKQLWDIIKNAMEQFHRIAGTISIDIWEFRKMFSLLLSQYSVGAIPVSLDRTVIGDMQMCRRRDLKCLIVLGATDDSMPKLASDNGIFTTRQRNQLSELGGDMPLNQEEQYCREMNIIYSTLTLPTQKLVIIYSAEGGKRPSFVVKRIKTLFGIEEMTLGEEEVLTAAEVPCNEFAFMTGERSCDPISVGAREYFSRYPGEMANKWDKAAKSINAGHGRLSPVVARKLYGSEPKLSASRVEKYYACSYAHFLKNGLRLKPRAVKLFDAPEAGTFTHYLLEGVSRIVKETVGYKNADESLFNKLTDQITQEYIKEKLLDFDEKNERFRYLFNRLSSEMRTVVLDMMEEISRSDFEPLDFELELSGLPDMRLSNVRLDGVIDRADVWEHNGVIYLRVVDYKTGKKMFSLSDIACGMGMQMLIYLFALQKAGIAGGKPIRPAGALYVPAREVIIKTESRDVTDKEIISQREKELRRAGLVLDEPEVIEAMENGSTKKYLPVKLKDDSYIGDSLVSAGRFKLLTEHVEGMLQKAAAEIRAGEIKCEPYYKNNTDNACMYCEYGTICAFNEENGDKRRYMRKMSAQEFWEMLEKGT